jgi:hypothetical protein
MVYNFQKYWVFGIYPSMDRVRKPNISEIPFAYLIDQYSGYLTIYYSWSVVSLVTYNCLLSYLTFFSPVGYEKCE